MMTVVFTNGLSEPLPVKRALPVPQSILNQAQKTPWNLRSKGFLNQVRLRQEVTGRDRIGQAAGHLRIGADGADGVAAARRTARNAVRRVQLDVGRQVARIVDGAAGGLVLFQRELVGRRVNL